MTPAALQLRAAGPADVAAVAYLERLVHARPSSEEALRGELQRADRHLVVAVLDGRPVGAGSVADLAGDAHVLSVAVAPEQRRRGIGRALVEALLAGAGERFGCSRATLEVRRANVAARRLYAGCGFAEVGVRPGYYPDGEDAVVLWCDDLAGRVGTTPTASTEAPA